MNEFLEAVAQTRNGYLIGFIQQYPTRNAGDLLGKLQNRKIALEREMLQPGGNQDECRKELALLRDVLLRHGKLFENN